MKGTRVCVNHEGFSGFTHDCPECERAEFDFYLKDGESPIARLMRERRDNDSLLTLLAEAKKRAESAEALAAERQQEIERQQAELAQVKQSLLAQVRTERDQEEVKACRDEHTWTHQFGDDWTPERGTRCDCGKKQWGIALDSVRSQRTPSTEGDRE